MFDVKVKNYGTIHKLAVCEHCDFSIDYLDRNALRKVRNHVRKTGHKVTVEIATVKMYAPDFPEKDEEIQFEEVME